jgi:hypothetical protein
MFFTALKEIITNITGKMLQTGLTNSQKIKNKISRRSKYGKSKVKRLMNHHLSGLKYFTLAPARKRIPTAKFNRMKNFLVNLRRKFFFMYGNPLI